jgi:nicotinate phosphoribosyltransferase
VVALAPTLTRAGIRIKGVRIDSGDLAEHARRVRAILDAGGLDHVIIFASGDLDEVALRDMLAAGAPVDGFGVGTHLDTSSDLPYLDCAYKLQEYAGRARRKRSEGKATWPGRKQVYRRQDADGRMAGDVVTLETDPRPGAPLLIPVLQGGRRLAPPPALADVRRHAALSLARLPEPLRRLDAFDYRVEIAPALHELAAQIDQNTLAGATRLRA